MSSVGFFVVWMANVAAASSLREAGARARRVGWSVSLCIESVSSRSLAGRGDRKVYFCCVKGVGRRVGRSVTFVKSI